MENDLSTPECPFAREERALLERDINPNTLERLNQPVQSTAGQIEAAINQ